MQYLVIMLSWKKQLLIQVRVFFKYGPSTPVLISRNLIPESEVSVPQVPLFFIILI